MDYVFIPEYISTVETLDYADRPGLGRVVGCPTLGVGDIVMLAGLSEPHGQKIRDKSFPQTKIRGNGFWKDKNNCSPQ